MSLLSTDLSIKILWENFHPIFDGLNFFTDRCIVGGDEISARRRRGRCCRRRRRQQQNFGLQFRVKSETSGDLTQSDKTLTWMKSQIDGVKLNIRSDLCMSVTDREREETYHTESSS